ncbi:class I adenylate cyclase [Thorsellia anophelis]|uniref:Adenylate cyclase n=1 Tax=Thorsellia anophelis DSM 18579 TaxID=1123402 RepID=A0A1I0B1U9_9GAMM|nr:class I adenylate cyclase [Thorsellia anophelis]SET00683.1 adenylate cyclase, class 1 [Thorsellia anophelis DSM 18579]
MHIYFERLKQRIDAVNQLRIERALEGMPESFRLVYQLIPLFIHFNHPAMPGYLQHGVPSGVAGFMPNDDDITRLLEHVDSLLNDPEFSLQTFCESSEYINLVSSRASADLQAPIIGIYSMGSTSFLGQNSFSDLDIWICHQSWLSEHEIEQLAHKCSLLESWANTLNIKLTLFLVDENRFRHKQSGSLDEEDCGTSQHYLLLDEFYRSAVRLAGKRLLWYLIPTEEEEHYDEYVTYLYSQGILAPNEWLDFGGMGALSAKEYFGASLWQLYKSIDSPYKAVIKSLLLEAYFADYPNTTLLAMEIKSHLHKGEIISSGLDAYVIMLRKISQYLVRRNDYKRLSLVRRCFYLKINEIASSEVSLIEQGSPKTSWRKRHIMQLVQSWGWGEEEILFLDNRSNWKIEQVKEAYDEILHAVMESFRNLIRFARQQDISVSASPKDISILTRKLYAAYEQLPGKITLINPQISPNLAERHLTFIPVSKGKVNRTGWYLFNRAPTPFQMLGSRTIEYSLYISKLVVWSYFNGLWDESTHIHIFNAPKRQRQKITQFYEDIKRTLSKNIAPASPSALYGPAEIREIMICLNLEDDPTHLLSDDQLLESYPNKSQRSMLAFDYYGKPIALVGSVDVVFRNSWDEIRTLNFTGENSLIESLESILAKMHQYALTPRVLKVFCYSQHYASVIAQEVETLFNEAIHLRLIHSIKKHATSIKASSIDTTQGYDSFSGRPILNSQSDMKAGVKLIVWAEHTYGLFFERRGVMIRKLERSQESFKYITEHKLSMLTGNRHNNAHYSKISDLDAKVVVPPIIESYACEGIIQFFFETEEGSQHFNTYILDERNEVDIFLNCEGSQEDLVKDVSRFYSASHERFTSSSHIMSFNLPQFYRVKVQGSTQTILPYD